VVSGNTSTVGIGGAIANADGLLQGAVGIAGAGGLTTNAGGLLQGALVLAGIGGTTVLSESFNNADAYATLVGSGGVTVNATRYFVAEIDATGAVTVNAIPLHEGDSEMDGAGNVIAFANIRAAHAAFPHATGGRIIRPPPGRPEVTVTERSRTLRVGRR
jgi:hypothetical protein